MKRILTALTVLGMVMGASAARAATIGTITTSDGLLFTLSSIASGGDLDSDGLGDDLTYTLDLDTSGYGGDPAQYISWVSPNAVMHDGIQQTSAPNAGWVFHDGGANNSSGCNDVLASGKWCSVTAGTDTVLDGNPYQWMWDVDPNGAFTTPHLQAAWFGPDGKHAISLNFETPQTGGTDTGETAGATDTGATTGATTGGEVPEPTSMLLLGSGLAAVATRLRRNRK